MSLPNDTPEDRWQFWFNAVGIAAVSLLLGTFFYLYGDQLLIFLYALTHPQSIPDHR
jgi:hypothetical protein